MARDVASAISFLHNLKKPMPHGNIRPTSILVNDKLGAKLAWRGSDAIEQVRSLPPPARAAWVPGPLQKQELSNSAGNLRLSELQVPARDGPASNGIDRWSSIVVAKSVGKDIEDFGKLLLHMFYREHYDMLLASRSLSVERFEERIRANTEVPIKIQSLIQDCLDPEMSRRPDCKDIYLSLERVLETAQGCTVRRKVAQADLIDKLFPRSIAALMKEGKAIEPEYHECVTCLFCDICEFTVVSSRLDARDVQTTLNALYSEFDRICVQHEVFRIEMVGDSFVCVGGLDIKCPDHTARVARVALEMVAAVSKFQFKDSRGGSEPIPVTIRVGVHSGPVVATVLGSDRPRFTVLGDVVNVTSRLETTSSRNRVHVSDEVAQALRWQDEVLAGKLVSRGLVELKGKGRKPTWWLENDLPA